MNGDKVIKMFLYSMMMPKSKKYIIAYMKKQEKIVFILAGTFLYIIQCIFCLLLTERGTLTLERGIHCVQIARRLWIASAYFLLVTFLHF